MIQKGKAGGLEALDYWKIEEYLEKEATTLGKIVTEAKEAPKGVIDYVVGPNVIGIMCHENQGHPSEGDRILGREGAQAGESYLNKEMIGERIGSENVTSTLLFVTVFALITAGPALSTIATGPSFTIRLPVMSVSVPCV